MATVITENMNAPYYGYRGCKKILPRAVQYWNWSQKDIAEMVISEEKSLFPDFSFSAFNQTFSIQASSAGRFWIECNSIQGYSNTNADGETYYEPYRIFLYSNINDITFMATQSDIYSEARLEYYRYTSDYVKYIIKGCSYNNKQYYVEYIFKSDGVIQIKSSQTITGAYLAFSIDKNDENHMLLNNITLGAGISYVIKLTGSLTNPVATIYERACIDYNEEYPIVGLLSIANPPLQRHVGGGDTIRPTYRNLVYPRGVLNSKNVLRINTPVGIGEILLSSSPNYNLPHLGVGLNSQVQRCVDNEGSIEEYLVRQSDWYSNDDIYLKYTNFYVNTFSTNRYWNEVSVEYLLTPVTGVTKIDILFRNKGGSDVIPNSSYRDVYLCYVSSHGQGSQSSNSRYWKNVRYTLKKAYVGGCIEMVTYTFSTPVTIAEFCLVPPPISGYSRWCSIDQWCIHTNDNVISGYAQNGAVRTVY